MNRFNLYCLRRIPFIYLDFPSTIHDPRSTVFVPTTVFESCRYRSSLLWYHTIPYFFRTHIEDSSSHVHARAIHRHPRFLTRDARAIHRHPVGRTHVVVMPRLIHLEKDQILGLYESHLIFGNLLGVIDIDLFVDR